MVDVATGTAGGYQATERPNRLFVMACLSLVVTAMTFAIRAGILVQLGDEFALSGTQLGWVNAMAFLGFPVAMMVGGLVYNAVGPKRLLMVAFVGHVIGLVLTILATGFWGLIVSTFFIGFANGAVEAACNPMIADVYHRNKTTMLNRFHVWFPGGIVIGALISFAMTRMGLGWQSQIGIMLIPTAAYGYMLFTQTFPPTRHTETSTVANLKALLSPLFIVMIILMTMTATTELGTGQWIERILAGVGASGLLVLALTNTIMAGGRFFAGPVIHRLNPVGVLLASAALSALGLFLFTQTSGPAVYLAAIVFAFGVTYFWPTMIGFVGEYLPRTGAVGMSLMGGAGMFGVSIWNPVIGGWLDGARESAVSGGLSGMEADVAAGQAVLGRLVVFPILLVVAFSILYLARLKRPEHAAEAPPVGVAPIR
ncbi:MFS transporter [Parvularcula dongshanensis]|uniref:MFS family permease n=1 Tax=Parvularcula dongshanensis TaxID=1173995 RepID=A0A840I003_9PROT|nr:MFS transporter [Parvularcula dongshanensis]MBB4657542.1 MFS family permease [Parvularcula dongshanensis]